MGGEKIKREILLPTAIVVVGLMIAVSATAIQIETLEEITFFVEKNPEMKIAGMEIASIIGEKQIIMQSKEIAGPVFPGYARFGWRGRESYHH